MKELEIEALHAVRGGLLVDQTTICPTPDTEQAFAQNPDPTIMHVVSPTPPPLTPFTPVPLVL